MYYTFFTYKISISNFGLGPTMPSKQDHTLNSDTRIKDDKQNPVSQTSKKILPIVCLSPVVLPELLDEVSKKSSSLKQPTSPCPAPSQPNKKGAKQHTLPGHSLGMMGLFNHPLIHKNANKTLQKQQAVTRADFLFAAPEKTRLALKHNFLLQVRSQQPVIYEPAFLGMNTHRLAEV